MHSPFCCLCLPKQQALSIYCTDASANLKLLRVSASSVLFPQTSGEPIARCIQVTFSTNPNAAGGPVLRSGPGQVLFSGQKLRQTLKQPGTLINTVKYKSLGLFPGQAVQTGEITILDGNRYQVRGTQASQ